MAQLESIAHVATVKPVPYMRQLCKHFGHNNEAEFADDAGSITFPYGRCELSARDGELALMVSAGEEEELERMERVIGSHLERFGKRDGLEVSWARSA